MKKALPFAFKATIPVMLGYLAIGTGFGLLFADAGYSYLWAALASLLIYAGAMQYIMLDFFTASVDLLTVAAVTLLVNMRHALYGLSFLETFAKMGWKKAYMIFALTDETYALLCADQTPPAVDKHKFIFCVALLNQSYWVLGSIIGAAAGMLIQFNTQGIDFAMTALFVVIGAEQWRDRANRMPALLGMTSSLAAVLFLGAAAMLLPAMGLIMLALLLFRKRLTRSNDNAA